MRKVPETDQNRRLDKAVDVLGLSGLLDRKPSALSGGQQQRVALGRALMAEAAVCLMDEPLSNLDAKLRLEMRREIRELQQRLGMTMVYVTHDQTEAMSMADTIILMQHGHIMQNARRHVFQPCHHLCGQFYRHAAHEPPERRHVQRAGCHQGQRMLPCARRGGWRMHAGHPPSMSVTADGSELK
ncbi:MAG: ATP-binding cassette domain-containing protein [Desulfovibrio sp.]